MSSVGLVGLSAGYPGRPVVGAIDLRIPRGSRVALIGVNGSGKSTLLRTIAGLLPPLAGTLHRDRESPVAYLGQAQRGSELLPLRARDIVAMARFPARGLFGRLRAEDRALVTEALDRVGMREHANAPLRTMSGGQRQRIALAHALARDASLLLLDEPTAGFDAAAIERYRAILDEERSRGTTVVVATHDVGEAERCDLVVLLAGRVVASGRPSSVLTPANLLVAFGVELVAVPHDGHTDLVFSAHDHAHPDPHDHPHHHRHGHRDPADPSRPAGSPADP